MQIIDGKKISQEIKDEVLLAIDPKKDVDGFHPVSVGNMVIGEKGFLPCTPAGVIQLLKRSGVDIALISELMGHSDLTTTQIYLDSFDEEQINTAMQHLV